MDEKGKVVKEKRIRNTVESLEEFVESVEPESKLALEAVGNWYYFYELLEKKGVNVFLSHPKKTKAIASAKIKTDKIDAKILAHLLRTDLLPLSYIPPKQIRDLREVIRYRASLVKERTVIKNRIKSVLLKNGVTVDGNYGQKMRKKVLGLSLRECFIQELKGYFCLLESFGFQIKQVDKTIRELALEREETRLLMTMPGIGYYSALLIYAEIGEIERFPSPGHLCSYAGLVPSVRSSGGKTRHGHITKEGSKWLRWILVEVSRHIAQGSVRFYALSKRVEKKHGKSAARIAVAREALRVIYRMLKHKEPFKGALKEKSVLPAISFGDMTHVQ
jgi:transposase